MKIIKILIIVLVLAGTAYAATKKWSALTELTAIADDDVLCVIDTGASASKKITVLNFFDTIDTYAELNTIVTDQTLTHNALIDTFSEINAIVADKTLVNEEDAASWDALGTFNLGITITTGDPFTLGTNRIDDGSDLLDGEMIGADTIDNDSIDWGDMTDLTTDGAVVWGNLAAGELTDDSINNADINWGDIDNLGDEGAVTVADTTDTTAYVALWESATGDLAAKTDAGLTYNAGLGKLTIGGSLAVTGSITSSTAVIGTAVLVSPRFDAAGDEDMDYGSSDVDDHTFTTDGTGDAEIVLPNDSIGDAEIDWSGLTTSADFKVTGSLVVTAGVDGDGAVDIDYGSADITDHTFYTDSTGDAEIVLPNDSIGDNEIDWSGLTTSHALTVTGSLVTSTGIDGVGAVDIDYGSVDVTDHTFITDSTGDSEIVLPNDSIGDAEIDWSGLTTSHDFSVTGSLTITGSLTVPGIAHLGDGSMLSTSAAPTIDQHIANKKYVDDNSGAATKWDDIGNSDSGAAKTISFDDGEVIIFSTAEDSTISFFNIDNTDADLAANVYLLDLEYSVDDAAAYADYLKCQDAGGVVFSIQENGDTAIAGSLTVTGSLTASGTLNAAILTEGGTAVHNNDEMDASSELATIIDDETGSGLIVFNDNPSFVDGIDITEAHDTAATGPILEFYRERDGAPTQNVSSGDYLGEIVFQGFHTGFYHDGAFINAIVDYTPGSNDMPTRLEFLTSADGSKVPTLRMTIDSGGHVAMTGSLTVTGSITSSDSLVATNLIISPRYDVSGAAGIAYGSSDVTAHTFTSDSTGDAEVVLPNDSIGDAEIDWSGLTTSADFTVTGSLTITGSLTVPGIAHLGDGSMMSTSAAPTLDQHIANKKYVDDNVASTAYDDIGDPDAASTITFADEETVTYSTGSDGEVFFRILDTDNALAGATTLLDLAHYSAESANIRYLVCTEDYDDVPKITFMVGDDGDLTLQSDGVLLAADGDGALSITGLGDNFDENIIINLDDVENTLGITSTTGVVTIDMSIIGITSAGNNDFGGADLELPQGQTPDTDGDIDLDFTDGSVVVQHGSAHAELSSSTDVVVGKLIHSFSATIFAPDGVNDVIPLKMIDDLEFPHGVVIVECLMQLGTDSNYVLAIFNYDDFDTINSSNGTIDTINYTAGNDGEVTDTSPTYSTIAAGQIIMLNVPATDVDWMHIEVFYYEPIS